MKLLQLSLILFCVTVAANIISAQTPRGVIAGNVANEDGSPVAHATIIIKLKGSNDYNQVQTVSTDKDGSFTVSVEAGVYVVITESTCASSRTENVVVPHNKSATVNVKLVNEDCNQKEAEKQFEWKVCEQEMSIPGLQIGDADKAEIINQILDELFKFESGFMSDNYQEIIFSTANIDPAWLKSFPGINFSFLTPQKIQVKANSSKEGRVDYYAFNWQPGNTCAFVGISAVTAVSINKPERKDPNVFYCPVGTSKGYLFRKEAGIWKMKQSRG